MKKFLLIPIMTLMCSVMAWGNPTVVNDYAGLADALANGGEIQLEDDIECNGQYACEVMADFNLDLNGHRIYGNKAILFTAMNLMASTYPQFATVVTGIISNGTIESTYTTGGSGVLYVDGINLTLNNVNITSVVPANSSSTAIKINSMTYPTSVTMNGGTITGRVTVDPTQYGQSNACSFTMNSGTINGDTIGVYVKDAAFTMNGGTINTLQNRSEQARGVYASHSTVTVDGGNINAYSTHSTSGDSKFSVGINAINTSTVTISETVANSTNIHAEAGSEAVGIFLNGSNLTVNGGTISAACYEDKYWAFGLREENGSSVTFNDGLIRATGGYAAGVHIRKNSSLTMADGEIYGATYGIQGNGSTGEGGTTIAISGGVIKGTTPEANMGIYHPQQGSSTLTKSTLTISGNAEIEGHNTGIEIRAGELNISGNPTISSTANFYDCNPNGSGTTTNGAAVAISQHTTKQPITVNISGGTFQGFYAISQSNPQENPEEYVNLLTLSISGGKFWSTNTTNVAAYTENDKLSLTGGYYNLAPHAFVAANYVAVNNPKSSDDDIAAFNEGYLFKVVPLESETFSTLTDGNWVVEDTWKENESVADHIPTQHTNVTIPDGGNVFVQPTPEEEEVVAYAHNLTLAGNATLTVKDGATLVLGNEANVDDNAKLVVEAGGQLLIAPSETAVHPVGSVTLIADAAGLKQPGLDDSDPNNLYWQHFAIPTTEAPTIRVEDKNGQEITTPITYYNTWDIVNGWENVLKTDMNTPFQGYNLSNDREYHSDIRYIFSGPLVGNASNPLVFARRGFSFFGNSYLAPINIRALQAAMYEQGMEYTVYVYVHRNSSGPQIYRAINDVTAGIYGIEEIKPMEGFFMFAEEASQADFQYNSAVYSAFLNKQMGGNMVNNAPARNAKSAYDAKAVVAVEAQNGESDEVILVASENFSNDYDLKADARKMENAGMNIYADGAFDDLAVMATNDLMGQTLSFKAGKDALYTMTFSNVEGELALYDNEVNQTISIAEGSTYTFAAQPNSTVNGRFEIVKPAMLPTAIENTEVKVNVKGIYTITGQYVGENFEAIPAGVYVVNGVKIVK